MLNRARYNLLKGNRRVIFENFLSLSTLEVGNMLMSFVTLPYVLRVLGQGGYGVYSMSFALVGYFATFVDYAFSISGTRLIAENRDDIDNLRGSFFLIMKAKAYLLGIALILFLLLVLAVPQFRQNAFAYILAFPVVLGNMLFTDWFFQGIERMRFVTMINISIKLLFTLSVFFLIRSEDDALLYIFLQSVGYLIAGIIAQLVIRKKYNMSWVHVPFERVFRELRNGLPLFLNLLLPNFYVASSILLLGIWHQEAEVGTFDSLRKIVMLACSIIIVLTRTFFPYLSRNKDSFRLFARLSMIVTVCIMIALIAAYPIVFLYLNISDFTYISVFVILSVNVMGFSMNKIFGQNYLVTHHLDRLYLRATAIASISGALISIPLIYFWSSLGAAATILISNLISGLSCFFYYKKNYHAVC